MQWMRLMMASSVIAVKRVGMLGVRDRKNLTCLYIKCI